MNDKYTEIDGKFYKECYVVMLPTKKASNLTLFSNNTLILSTPVESNVDAFVNQHLYFLSDEEISQKRFRWIVDYRECMNNLVHEVSVVLDSKLCPEIIASTDSSLGIVKYTESGNVINTGIPIYLPRPSNDFINIYIEKYNKGNKIGKVLVEMIIDKYDKRNQYKDVPSGKYSYDEPAPQSPNNLYTNASHYIPKIADDNTITTRPITLKKDKLYTREEMIEFGKIVLDTFHSEGRTKSGDERLARFRYDNWVTKKLS